MKRLKPSPWRWIRREVLRALRVLALMMMAIAACLGVPLIIDPPPRDHSADCQEAEGRLRPKRRRRRS